jgi:PEP-CTERM motif
VRHTTVGEITMLKLRIAVIVASIAASAAAARAEQITYIFSGTASGVYGGLIGFLDAPFNVTLVGDTGNVTSGGTEWFNQATSATFNVDGLTGTLAGSFNEAIVNNDPSSPRAAFGQAQSASPFFVAEALQSSAFETYDLSTAFPLTSGTPEFITQIFETGPLGGILTPTLEFDSASLASFQAVVLVPEPSTWAMMLLGFAGLGFAGYSRTKARSVVPAA